MTYDVRMANVARELNFVIESPSPWFATIEVGIQTEAQCHFLIQFSVQVTHGHQLPIVAQPVGTSLEPRRMGTPPYASFRGTWNSRGQLCGN
jgi:hypothetical protein